MRTGKRLTQSIGALLVLSFGLAARAEITSLTGSVSASVQEIRMGIQGDSDTASDGYPSTSSELPLQVVAILSSAAPDVAAGSAAAQFADPRDLNQQNPEEFAINLTLSSASLHVRYTATATSQEVREVSFSETELGQPAGSTAALTGRLFVDGALVVFSPVPGRDLTGAYVRLHVTIVKQVAGQEDETVFSGTVELTGGRRGSATTSAQGQFPTTSLILSDLSALPDEFAALHVLILPNLAIDYSYQAVVGEAFTFVATVTVEAANVQDAVGVVALIGTPTNTLSQVVAATQGQQAAAKLLSTIQKERAAPTGQPAFPAQPLLPSPFGLCGLFGFEWAIGLSALVGLKFAGARRRIVRG